VATQPVTRGAALSGAEWRVLLLLVVSSFLNYFDRSNLSAGATDIQRELHLSSYQLGVLLSAFFRTYAAFQLFAISGWLVDRFNVCWILAGGFFLWSAATAVTGVAQTFAMVFLLRLCLGMGESIAYPAYSRILANNFPEHHRGIANAIIDAGTKLGPAAGTLLGGLLMAIYGWRAFFIALGFGSLLWLVPWLIFMPRGHGVAARQHAGEMPSVWAILCQRSAWFSALGLFCTNYFWYFLLTWLPPYLETERHFSKQKMAWFGSAAYFAVALSCIFSGWMTDRLIARGGTATAVRKSFAGVGLLFSTLILPVCIIQNDRLAMLLLMLACLSYGLFTANLFAITQTLAGPRAAGKWTGMQNGFGNLAGVAAPWLTGFIVQQTGRFYLAFVVAAAIVLLGAVFFVLGIGPIRQVEWRKA
jgi:MFS transporter, ACS family, D-galactonate transporter